MELPVRLCALWALLLCAGGGGDAAPAETQPPVTNLSVSVENLCTIIWTWNPPEGASPNCSLWYFSHFGNKQDKKIAPETYRSKEVALNERICLQVGSQCSTNESDNPSILVEKCISPPEGDPESAVTELQCVWHNLRYMKCTWLPGRNTSPDTNYTLYYWLMHCPAKADNRWCLDCLLTCKPQSTIIGCGSRSHPKRMMIPYTQWGRDQG